MTTDPAFEPDDDDITEETRALLLALAIEQMTDPPTLPALQQNVIAYDLTVAEIARAAGLPEKLTRRCLTGQDVGTIPETHDLACAINALIGLYELRCLRGCCLPFRLPNGGMEKILEPCPHADNEWGACRWDRPALAPTSTPSGPARRDAPAMRDRLLDCFCINVGVWLTADQQRDAYGGVDYQRSRRALVMQGWRIEVDKRNGSACLIEDIRHPTVGLDPRRGVPARMRVAVLERDGGRCQLCGIGKGEMALDGKPARIEIDHIIPWSQGGPTSPENLRALCHVCNHDKKDGMFDPLDPTTWRI